MKQRGKGNGILTRSSPSTKVELEPTHKCLLGELNTNSSLLGLTRSSKDKLFAASVVPGAGLESIEKSVETHVCKVLRMQSLRVRL